MFPSFPRLRISRDTSAAFVVRYLSVAPETGSYVFRVRAPRGGFVLASVVVVVVGCASPSGDFLVFRGFGFVMEYLVVMRVCFFYLVIG